MVLHMKDFVFPHTWSFKYRYMLSFFWIFIKDEALLILLIIGTGQTTKAECMFWKLQACINDIFVVWKYNALFLNNVFFFCRWFCSSSWASHRRLLCYLQKHRNRKLCEYSYWYIHTLIYACILITMIRDMSNF